MTSFLDRVGAPLDRRLGERPGAWRQRIGLGPFLGLCLLALVAGVVGVLVVDNRPYAILVAVTVLALGAAAIDLGIVCAIAVPASLVMLRVGGFLSVADVVLAGATVVAMVLMSAREAQPMQPLVWLAVLYQAMLVPTLILNPYTANYVEWVHEAVLIIGSLMVGWVVGRRGAARLALNIYQLVCCGIGIAAVVAAFAIFARTGEFGAVYLPYMHKNFIGNALAFSFVIAYARPVWIGWSRSTAVTMMAISAAGIAASQARQAIIATVIGAAVVNLRPRVQSGTRSRLIWFAAIPAVVFVVNAVNAQLQSGNEWNSANQRIIWFRQSIDIWQESPIFGVGLRWWYTDRFNANFQPPNAEFEMLTSGGVVGLLGFLVLFLGATWVLARMDPIYGTVALAVVITRFTQGQFDLYWVAGQSSFLWIVAGIAYGVQARDKALGTTYDLPRRTVSPWRPPRHGTPLPKVVR
ncbi:O-antigen ligase family protein [Mumia sp. DW29H23]|uniref:O-antigen ligase family protein n=1 Tax=Mumia sp. DW29H23 TaxID=3421241 RepID=UPI003D688A12